MNERKPYKVLKPIALDGIRRTGEIVDLTNEQAANIGEEYLAPESEPVTTGETKVEDKAAVKPKSTRKAKSK